MKAIVYSGMLVGREIEVVASRDVSLLGLKGVAIDDTKNLLVLATGSGRKVKLPKSVIKVKVSGPTREALVIEGSNLIGTPADRIKG